MKKQLLLLVLMMLPVVVNADTVEINGIYYNLNADDNTAEVTESPNKYTGSIEIPESVIYDNETYGVTSIGLWAFDHCTGLTSITIPNSVTNIGSQAFNDCSGLTSINIPNSVTAIGRIAFNNCTGLTSITIPNSVTSIEDGAFSGCTSLSSIFIPNSVTSISGNAFDGTAWFDNQPDGVVYLGLYALKYKGEMPNNTFVVIKDGTKFIADGAFCDYPTLTSVTIPNSVTSIGYMAFLRCSALTSINIPTSVTSIGGSAFGGTGLTSITIPNSVTSIEEAAFSGCTGLTTITIPNSVTSIGTSAFYGCSGLTSVTIPNSVTSIGNYAFQYCTDLISVTIPNSVTTIGNSAFSRCSNLTSVSLGNSVTTIGSEAFYYCSSLSSISFPDSILSIDQYAFSGTAWLYNQPDGVVYAGLNAYSYKGQKNESTKIELKEGTIGISSRAFCNFYHLNSIIIPNSVKYIGWHAFEGCALKEMYCYANQIPFIQKKMFYNNNIADITLYVPFISLELYKQADPWKDFKEIKGIKANIDDVYYYPKSDTEVIVSGGANKAATEVVIHSTINANKKQYAVTSIDEEAFSGYSVLKKITIGSEVTSVGVKAFANCPNLEDVYCYAVRYPTASADAFENSYMDYVTLHVPTKSVTQYKNHAVWGRFMDVVPITDEEMEINQVSVTKCINNAPAIYNLNGQRANSTSRGLNIINGRKVIMK